MREPARDLIDFFQRWHEFRPTAERLRARPDLSEAEREVLGWMVKLIDRLGSADVAT